MIWECVEIFKRELEKNSDKFVLDNYIPKDGTYFIIKIEKDNWEMMEPIDITYDKKQERVEGEMNVYYEKVCFLDYYSKLIDMDKALDRAKKIHSNNYLSFFVKKENLFNGALTVDIIKKYYDVFRNLNTKYGRSPESKKLYEETEKLCGQTDIDLIKSSEEWINTHIFKILKPSKEKDYLKLFFVFPDWNKTKQLFIQEGTRYFIPNIYNNNKYNTDGHDGKILGLPNNNLQMNGKKPYLGNMSRKNKAPFLLDREQVLLQSKFYDYLEGFAAKGKYDVYFDIEKNKIRAYKSKEYPGSGFYGYYIRIKKGKEVEIQNVDVVVYYNPNLRPAFLYKQILEVKESQNYGSITKRKDLENLINEVFFNKGLMANYFTEPKDIPKNDPIVFREIVEIRERLFAWFYKNTDMDISTVLIASAWELIKNSFKKGNWTKTKHQLNLKWSLEDYFNSNQKKEILMNEIEKNMFRYMKEQDWDFKNDEEYYFGVGQMASFLIGKSRSAKKPMSFINIYLSAGNDQVIKEQLRTLFQKYSYDISYTDWRVKSLFSHLMLYRPNGKVNKEMIIAGATASNVIYKKEEED